MSLPDQSQVPSETRAEMREPLRTFTRDLVALSALAAAWKGKEPKEIGRSLATVTLGTINSDAVVVTLTNQGKTPLVTAVSAGSASDGAVQALQLLLESGTPSFPR